MEKRTISMDCPMKNDEGPTLCETISDETIHDPSAEAVKTERNAAVTEAITTLPWDQRQVVLLRDMEGMPYEKIADLLSLPVGTVRSRLHRGREELKRRLASKV